MASWNAQPNGFFRKDRPVKRLLRSVIRPQGIASCFLARTNLCIALAILLFISTPCYPYEPETHAEIAKAAFKYMYKRLAEDRPGTIYHYLGDKQMTSAQDYEIALKWMGVKPGDTQHTIQDRYAVALKHLADAASAPDFYRDIYFRYKKWFLWPFLPDCTNEIDNRNYTSLSHFLLMHQAQADIWQIPGYTYELSNRDGLDKTAFQFFATLGGVEVATNCQYPSHYYPHDPNLLVKDKDLYEANWKRALKDVRFPPATSMAWHHYNHFLDSAPSGIAPSDTGIRQLGPVLHAVHDVTVPHHVIGVLGYGHEDYEILVKQSISDIIDFKRVRNFLTVMDSHQGRGWDTIHSALKEQDLRLILEHLGEYVLFYEEFPPSGGRSRYDTVSHKYNPELDNYTDNIERARELVNLAIAANVVILRKAIHEWPRQAKPQIPTRMMSVEAKSQDIGRNNKLIYDENYKLTVNDFLPSSFLARISEGSRTDISTAITSVLALFDASQNNSMVGPQVDDTLSSIECRLITAFDGMLIEHKWITAQHPGKGYSMNAVEIGYLNREPRFRDPHREEMATNTAWKEYKERKDTFKRRFVGIQALIKKTLMQPSAMRSGYFPPVTFAEAETIDWRKLSDPCNALDQLEHDYRTRVDNSDRSLNSIRAALREATEKYNKMLQTIHSYQKSSGEGTEREFTWQPWQRENNNKDYIYAAYQELHDAKDIKELNQGNIPIAEYARRRAQEDMEALTSVKDDLRSLDFSIKQSFKQP